MQAWGLGPQKLGTSEKFKNVIKALHGHIPRMNFTKFSGLWTDPCLVINSYLGDSIKGLHSMGVQPQTCFLQIFSAPSDKTIRPIPQRFRGAEIVQISSLTMPSLVGLTVCMLPGGKMWGVGFLCLSVMLLNVKVCECNIIMKSFAFRTDFFIAEWGRVFVVVTHIQQSECL